MANKEEVLIKVKAEIDGFKKSMDQIKKLAKDAVKDIEKSMAMDLTDAGIRAGRTFVNGFKSQVNNITSDINASLKNVDANIEVKLEADADGIKDSLGGLSGSVDIDTSSATSKLDSFGNLFSASMMSSAAGSMNGVSSSILNTYDSIKDIANAMTAVNTSASTYAKYVGYGEKAIDRLKEAISGAITDTDKLARIASIVDNELSNIYSSDLLGGFKKAGIDTSSLELVFKQVKDLKKVFDSMFSSMINNGNAPNNALIAMSKSVNTTNQQVEKLKKNFSKIGDAISKTVTSRIKALATSLASIVGRVTGLNKVANAIKNIGNHSETAASKASSLKSTLGKLAGLLGLYQLGSYIKEGTKEAIKYEAALMNIQRTLGNASKSLVDFANNNAVGFGLSKRQVMDYGNIFSMMVSNFEEDGTKVAKTTEALLRAAGAIATGTGRNVEEVLESLRSGILGSSEAVDQLGLNLKTAQLAAAAGVDSWNDLSEAQKQAIITQEILNQTVARYGGVAKNTASMHNAFVAQLANTKLALGNVAAAIYTAILPALTYIMAVLEKVFNYVAKVMSAILGLFGLKVQFSGGGGTGGAVSNLSDSMGNLSDTAGGAGKALDNAGNAAKKAGSGAKKAADDTKKAAKEIKRALAGFDQINVLNLGKDSDSSGGSSGSGGGGGSNPGGSGGPGGGGGGPSSVDLNKALVDTEIVQTELSDKMKNILNELLEPFKNAWDLLGDRWKKAWMDLQVSFKNFCDALSDLMVSVWNNGGKTFVQHLAEIALAVGIAAMEIGGTILDSLAALWRHLDPENNPSTQNFLNSLNEVAVKVRDLILDLNGHFESLMKYGGQDVLNALGTMFMDLGDAATRGVGVVIDAIDGLLDHLDPVNNEITRNMLTVWEDAFLSIGNAARSFADLIESILSNGGQDVLNSIGDLLVQIGVLCGTILDEVADVFNNLFQHMDPSTNKNSAKAIEGFKYFVDSLKGFVEMLGNALITFMDNGGREFVNNVGDIIAILIDLTSTIAGDIINAVTGFFNSWAGQSVIALAARTLELLSSIIEGLLEILRPLTPVISAVVAAILAFKAASKVVDIVTKVVNVFKTFGSMLSLVKNAAAALWAILSANPIALVVAAIVAIGVALVAAYNKFDWFKEAVDKVLKRFEGYFNALKGLFTNLINDITNIFQDIIDIIVGIFTGDGQRVGEAVKSLLGNILQLFGDLVIGIVDVGINLITGLIKGIGEGIMRIPKAIEDLCTFIVDFFKGLFGINSPSTVFAELGGFLIEGLANGITNSINLVTDAVSKVWEGITGVFEKASKWFGDIWDSVKKTTTKKWNNIKKGVTDSVDKVKKSIGDKKEDFKTTMGTVWDNIKNGVSGKWNNIKTETTKKTDEVKKAIGDKKEQFKSTMGTVWDNIKSGISGKWNEIKSETTKKLDEVKKAIGDKKDQFKSTMGTVWDNIKGAVSGKWNEIKSETTKKVDEVKKAIGDKKDQFKTTMNTVWDGIKSGISGKWNEIKSETTKKVDEVKKAIGDKKDQFKSTMGTVWDGIKSGISGKWNEIKSSVSTSLNNVKGAITGVKDSFTSAMGNIWDGIKSGVSGKWSGIKSAVSTAIGTIKSAITGVKDSFTSAMGTVWDGIKSGVSGKWAGIKSVVSTSIGTIKSAITSVKGSFTTAMGTVWDGIKSGVSGKWAGIKSAVSTAIANVKSAVTGLKWSIPKPSLPSFKATIKWTETTVLGKKFKYPSGIKWNRLGGIFNKPTIFGTSAGLQGVGESGAEAILPLNKLWQEMDKRFQRQTASINNSLMSMNSGNSDNRPLNITLKLNDIEMGRATVDSLKALAEHSGELDLPL